MSRLELLRKALRAEPAFPEPAISEPAAAGVRGGGGLPRASKKLPKPDWLRIQATEGSQLENYQRLKSTVKSLGWFAFCFFTLGGGQRPYIIIIHRHHNEKKVNKPGVTSTTH